jgi:hypothetical protein
VVPGPARPGHRHGHHGFGGGALIASPLSTQLLAWYDSGYDPSDPKSVATGSAVTMLFVTLGLIYFAVMMYGAFTIRVPPEGWKPEGFDPATLETKPLVTSANVSAANAIRTPSFWLLWTVLLCNVTAGIGILEQASPMIQDFFRDDSGSSSVTVAVASPPCRPTCGTCSAPSRWGRSTAGCSPPGRSRAWPAP